jgi:hypothetical protein
MRFRTGASCFRRGSIAVTISVTTRYSHRDLNDLSVQTFADEVARGEAVFRPLLPASRSRPLYLRFPFNHTGDTMEKRAAVAALLAQRGYEVAVCTIDNSDYIFADAYDRARATSGGSSAAIIRTEYLAHTAKIIDYYVGLHRTVFGRETAHVMLLHVNRLNADVLDALLTLFEERQFQFVSLADAQADPAYRRPTHSPRSSDRCGAIAGRGASA